MLENTHGALISILQKSKACLQLNKRNGNHATADVYADVYSVQIKMVKRKEY
jgi:hypothetical protein